MMLTLRHEGEISQSIILPVAVDVMNMLISAKRSSEMFSHNQPLSLHFIPTIGHTKEGMIRHQTDIFAV